jgi:drug/metabolite transporter (DMT)-like permease
MALHRSTGRHWLGFTLACVTMLTWGLLPLPLKALLHSMEAESIVWYRFLIASLVVGGTLAAKGRLPRVGTLGPRGWTLLVLATLGLGANYIGYMQGLDRTTPAVSQVVIQLAPPILALGGLVIFGERFTRLQWIGFGAILVGLGLFFRAQVAAFLDDLERYYAGTGWIAFAALVWAVYGLAQKQLLVRLTSQGVMVCVYAGCAVLFTPLASPASIAALTPVEVGLLLFCGLNTAIAYGCFSEALAHWEASRVSAVLALTPLATIGFSTIAGRFWSDVLGPDPVTPWALVGAVVVVAGSMTTALAGRRVARPDRPPADPVAAPGTPT